MGFLQKVLGVEKVETLPLTTATTAEERLEELVKNKSIWSFKLLGDQHEYEGLVREVRLFPDGLEYLWGESGLNLYVQPRKTVFYYQQK